MTYDIYCYRPQSGTPSVEEARRIIEQDPLESSVETKADPRTKWRIASALLKTDSRLSCNHSEQELKQLADDSDRASKVGGIALYSEATGFAMEIFVGADTVSFGVPYWYEGEEAGVLFENLSDLLKTIAITAGYFVYDPQLERAYDPLASEMPGKGTYAELSRILPDIIRRFNP